MRDCLHLGVCTKVTMAKCLSSLRNVDHRTGARTVYTLLIVELSALLWRLHSGLYFVDTRHVLVDSYTEV